MIPEVEYSPSCKGDLSVGNVGLYGFCTSNVIRNGLTVERKDVKDSNLSKTKHDTKYMTYDWNFYMIVLPIPKKEMDANPNMEQNPEYGGR